MRIALAIADELLRDALADLLEARGHSVTSTAQSGAVAELLVRDAPGPRPARAAAVLTLRPARASAAAANPLAALEHALRTGGEAVWGPPLDPRLLLSALAAPGVKPAQARETLDAPLASSAEAWWLLDAERRLVLDATTAARRSGGSVEGPLAEPSRLPWAAHVAAVLARSAGRAGTSGPGAPGGLVVWWTPRAGRRLVGWFPAAPAAAGGVDDLHALAELGRVSGTFAHEVRNPLASMASAIDLLKRDLGPGERAEVAALAKARLEHMRGMLDDTLRLVRPFRDPPAAVDLETVVASAFGIAQADPAFAGVTLSLGGVRPLPCVQGHAEPLRQALTNLLVNAAHAQGGSGTVRVLVARAGARVVLGVEDEGPGIPPELREKVFEPFWTTKATGTGLGLAYVRRVAEACGGSVRATVGPRGARLELDLPAS